jgi:SAM-dependent methyltransferase
MGTDDVSASRSLPYPPLSLASRVCCLERWADPREAYDQLGADTRDAILDLLPAGWTFDGKRVLDFGCGAGRTLRHLLGEAEVAEIWGCDIDAASVNWLAEHLSPPLRAVRNEVEPPLGLDYGTFDLIWALSVFTHLTDQSLPWLVELHRLLKPGGFLLATYMGRWNSEVFTHEPWDDDRIGMNVLRRDQGWDDGGPMVLMSDWWVREHWGRAFEIVETLPERHGQTWVLLKKRNVSVSAEDLERPSEDPREWTALRHNLRQVERDRQLALGEVRGYYEGALSWRITRPLREVARRARKRLRFR